MSNSETSFIAPSQHIGYSIQDVLNKASSVRVTGFGWMPILGYDEADDTLCLENYTGDDITLSHASEILHIDNIRVHSNVEEE